MAGGWVVRRGATAGSRYGTAAASGRAAGVRAAAAALPPQRPAAGRVRLQRRRRKVRT